MSSVARGGRVHGGSSRSGGGRSGHAPFPRSVYFVLLPSSASTSYFSIEVVQPSSTLDAKEQVPPLLTDPPVLSTRRSNFEYCISSGLRHNRKGIRCITHPAPWKNSASIAAVVASMDWPNVSKYRSLLSKQRGDQEIISDLYTTKGEEHGGMIRDLLKGFYKSTNEKPKRIIFYRDGVGEGQFNQVLLSEVAAIRLACTSIESDYRPGITFIVVQKRHHTRLFPKVHGNQGVSATRNGNILPGYLQNTILLSLYARCTNTVSIVPPAYYAHLAAARARYYIDEYFEPDSDPVQIKLLEGAMRQDKFRSRGFSVSGGVGYRERLPMQQLIVAPDNKEHLDFIHHVKRQYFCNHHFLLLVHFRSEFLSVAVLRLLPVERKVTNMLLLGIRLSPVAKHPASISQTRTTTMPGDSNGRGRVLSGVMDDTLGHTFCACRACCQPMDFHFRNKCSTTYSKVSSASSVSPSTSSPLLGASVGDGSTNSQRRRPSITSVASSLLRASHGCLGDTVVTTIASAAGSPAGMLWSSGRELVLVGWWDESFWQDVADVNIYDLVTGD
ncbi:hypothetical protein ZIOFF_054856 [Zingiber officinale]|uniref:Piwi domain-containing protein n=1 Tax=Zingiber officinale TaxID=94328 RepID=A0A8J5FEM3_ZINOF|nr:hypothetical protein ZIOFF_054856 [Zingiber officinale]